MISTVAKTVSASLSSRPLQSISQYKPALMQRGPVCDFQAIVTPSHVNFALQLAKRGGFVADGFDLTETSVATTAAEVVDNAPAANDDGIETIHNDNIINAEAQQASRRLSISKDLARTGGELVVPLQVSLTHRSFTSSMLRYVA
jgi:hypothetical protein